MDNGVLGTYLKDAVAEFHKWWEKRQNKLDVAQKVKSALFHYTDANGLAGIIKNQEIWFTNIFHLNDPSELAYGIEIACAILREKSEAGDEAVKFFCERLKSVLLKHVGGAFGFYVSSFSRSPDDLGQWRAYADNGRGFAIGLAPYLFHTEHKADPKPNEIVYVSEVTYDRADAEQQQQEAIEFAIEIINRPPVKGIISSGPQGTQFLQELSAELTVPILWNSITTKHSAYQNENETRLLIVNELTKLAPHIEMRTRGSNLIPFIRSPMPIREDGSITEIVIGPSANTLETEDAIKSLLISHGLSLKKIKLRPSSIPYRA